MTLDEASELLRCNGSEALDLHLKIIRDIGSSAVVLFAVSAPHGVDELKLAGSGTLVTNGSSYWILTAAHVWKENLMRAEKVGITLRANTDHRFLFDTNTLQVNTCEPEGHWSERGPDLALIRVPPVTVGTIEANKSFYLWRSEPAPFSDQESLEGFYLLGTPADLGTFTENHASVELCGFHVSITGNQNYEGFDFIDVDAYIPQGTPMQGFGGVSGGGLWRTRIFIDATSGQPDWVWRLDGTAFFQFPVQGDSAIIRCHGPNSLRQAIASVTP